jgi:hypothetical protein
MITPDATEFSILDYVERNNCLVLKVKYPSCEACSFEGVKILVYENCTAREALEWKTIDPHFRDPDANRSKNEAPPPIARFPASAWCERRGLSIRLECVLTLKPTPPAPARTGHFAPFWN